MGDTSVGPFDTFRTTIWEDLRQVQDDTGTVRANAQARLVARYLPALRAHLVIKKRIDSERADDLLQGFFTDKILAGDLLTRADRARGKLRALLVRSLENYIRDQFRAEKRRRFDRLADAEAQPAPPGNPDFIDIAWARQVLEETVAAVRADCQQRGQEAVWGVFEARMLIPLYSSGGATPYEQLAKTFDFQSPRQAENALITAKRKFERAFRQTIDDYLEEDQPPTDVVAELLKILAGTEGVGWQSVSQGWPSAGLEQAELRGFLDEADPRLIARMLEADDKRSAWQHADLAYMLRQELEVRLGQVAPRSTERSEFTLGVLLHDRETPVELLVAIKRYGGKQAHEEDRDIPLDIATVLYFASIAAALVHKQARITKLDDDALHYGFGTVLTWGWLDQSTRGLLAAALSALRPHS